MAAFTVAIDGPAAAGKGTISRAVARRFGFRHLDTGLLYRAVAKMILEDGKGKDEEAALGIARRLRLEDTEMDGLRSAEVSRESSRVAAMPSVRAALKSFQRDFARRDGGAVLDGRDIGTVIAPDAEVKLFVTASEEVRAGRRRRELALAGARAAFRDVLHEIRQRDRRDIGRGFAALRMAEDALLLDTSKLTIDEAVSEAVAAVHWRLGTGPHSRPALRSEKAASGARNEVQPAESRRNNVKRERLTR